ncbi:type IV secretion system protein [Edaphobacter paludis]|uniref:Type IV secretion system protein n=1 Tax=Edaphobacter paludis TaxID=3035702 RepID=A0AAU7DCT3_9BACT
MDFLILIKNGCDNLTATVAPSVDSLGVHMVLSLATIMLVWFGVQEALASAQGGAGFSMAKFLNFFMLITFAYCFVKFYDSSIPGIGYSLKGFVSGGTNSLVDYIGHDSTDEVQTAIHTALGKVGTLSPSLTEPYTLLCTYTVQIILTVLTAIIGVIIAYGAIGATIIGLLGPVFIPWMVFDKTEFLFWGWLRAFLSFEFYKVVAAATMSVMSHLLITYLTSGAMNVDAPQRLITLMPGLLMLCFVAGFILLKIPAMTASLFSGHTGGHDAGMAMVTGMVTAGLLK